MQADKLLWAVGFFCQLSDGDGNGVGSEKGKLVEVLPGLRDDFVALNPHFQKTDSMTKSQSPKARSVFRRFYF